MNRLAGEGGYTQEIDGTTASPGLSASVRSLLSGNELQTYAHGILNLWIMVRQDMNDIYHKCSKTSTAPFYIYIMPD